MSKWLDELLEVREDRDWVGNKASIFATLAATSHSRTGERQKHDYYATEPRAVELLLEVEKFDKNILEPAYGEGHISKVLISHGYNVTSHDLIDRGTVKVVETSSKEQKNSTVILLLIRLINTPKGS